MVRRWSSDTRVNGHDFTESPLQPGDLLSVGPIDFEVLGGEPRPDTTAISQHAAASPRPAEPSSKERETLDARRRELEIETQNLARQRDELVRQRDELVRQQEAVQRQCEQFVQEQDGLRRQREELARHEQQLERRQQEFDADRSDLDRREADLREREAALQQREASALDGLAETPSQADRALLLPSREEPREPEESPREPARNGGSALSTHDVFRRLGIAIPTDEDEQPAPPARHVERPSPEPARAAHANHERHDGDEESIDDYMARLLNRAKEVSGPAQKAHQSSPAAPAVAAVAESTLDQTPEPEAPAVQGRGRARVKLQPRAVAPEKSVDLEALRDLANLSAKHAIGRHAKNRLRSASTTRLALAVAALVLGLVMAWLTMHFEAGTTALYAAGASFLAAMVFGVQYVVLASRMLLTRDAPGAPPRDATDTEQPSAST